MRKNAVVFSVMVLIVAVSIISYTLGANSLNIADLKSKDVAGKTDYPLIEVSFNENCEFVIVNRYNLFTDEEVFEVAQNNTRLQLCKEDLKLLTFPTGRGTTPNGIIYVYCNGELIKEVPYLEVYFETDSLKDSFQQMKKEKIEKELGCELPPAI